MNTSNAVNPMFRNGDGSINFDRLFAAAKNEATVTVHNNAAEPVKTVKQHLDESYRKAGVDPRELMPLPETIQNQIDEHVEAAAAVTAEVVQPAQPAAAFNLVEMTDEEKAAAALVTVGCTILENLSSLRFDDANEDLIAWVCKAANENEQVKARADELGIECILEEDGSCKIVIDEPEIVE